METEEIRTMLKVITLLMIASLSLFTAQALATDHSQMKPFPDAEKGMERFVIVLLIPGKTMLTDGVNQFRHGSSIEARPLEGWGYTFYEVIGQDTTISTMMAAPEGSEKVEQFVAGAPLLIRYNSRLPVVIYAPEGYEVKYRIWNAGKTGNADKK
jgi:ecotin